MVITDGSNYGKSGSESTVASRRPPSPVLKYNSQFLFVKKESFPSEKESQKM